MRRSGIDWNTPSADLTLAWAHFLMGDNSLPAHGGNGVVNWEDCRGE
jgi:hypothetical protein